MLLFSERTSSEEDTPGMLKFDRVELTDLSRAKSGRTDFVLSPCPFLDSSLVASTAKNEFS